MKIIGDVTISLPYTLDFCAKGPDVEPIVVTAEGVEVTLFFPPSMSDGTVGQSFFPSGWAWWTGSSLRLTASMPVVEDTIDVEEIREIQLAACNRVLRKFLNAYRLQFHKPNIYPLVIDAKDFSLSIAYENGTSDALPEPEGAFFYRRIPAEAPLASSVNSTTLQELAIKIDSDAEPTPGAQLALDSDWFDSLGDHKRAELLRQLLAANNQ